MDTLKDLTVFIGRFSPFHNGHGDVLKRALITSKAVAVLVGSSGQARTTKNPFTFEERKSMIEAFASTLKDVNPNLIVLPIYDHPYNDSAWIRGVQDAVDQAKSAFVDVIDLNPNVYITGADRDRSTWYLNAFGNYFKLDIVNEVPTGFELSATSVRSILFDPNKSISCVSELLPLTTFIFINSFTKTDNFTNLVKEYEYIEKYKAAWTAAPYAPTFVTVDTCVIQSGHVLVNVRDNFPGKGLWALPGGFVEQNEKLIDGAVRELIEETKIEMSKQQLYGSIKSKEIFDHPDRSLRGRTITTCFLLVLENTKPLPKVKAQKGEVKKVTWIPINEALNRREMWFEDHHAMLTTMVGRIPG